MIRIKDYIFSKENQLPCTCVIVGTPYLETFKWYTVEDININNKESKND